MLSEKALLILCKNCIVQEVKNILKSDSVVINTKINSFDDLSGDMIVESIKMTNGNVGMIQRYICTLKEDDETGINVSLTKFKNDIQ